MTWWQWILVGVPIVVVVLALVRADEDDSP
jgi:hypothetical protein